MIYVSDVIHKSGADRMHPEWDTMVAVRNISQSDIVCEVKLYREEDGNLVLWTSDTGGTGNLYRFVVKAGQSWAASFLPGNGFGENPPQDFQGHGVLESYTAVPFGSMDATSLLMPFVLIARNWASGVAVPVATNVMRETRWRAQTEWRLAYAIPKFDDRAGATAREWVTGISVQSFDSKDVVLHLKYTVGQRYAEAGKNAEVAFTVKAGCGARFDLFSGNPTMGIPGLASSGYPEGLNSEGHLDIVTADGEPALLYCSAIVADAGYGFMVKEEFW